MIEDACRPASPEIITAELARLQIATAGKPLVGVSAAAWLMVVGEELERYPADVVREACRRWVRREKWSPSVAELVEECERLVERRRTLLKAARKAPVHAEPDNPVQLLQRLAQTAGRMREADERPRDTRQVVSAVATQLRANDPVPQPQPQRPRNDHRAALRRVREEAAGMRLVPRGRDDDAPAPAAVDDCEGWGS